MTFYDAARAVFATVAGGATVAPLAAHFLQSQPSALTGPLVSAACMGAVSLCGMVYRGTIRRIDRLEKKQDEFIQSVFNLTRTLHPNDAGTILSEMQRLAKATTAGN